MFSNDDDSKGFLLTPMDPSEAPVRIYGNFGSDFDPPPPITPKPEIMSTCYICGKSFKGLHLWNMFTDELHLEMQHCGRTELRKLSLTQAEEVAKIGYLAFLT